MMTDPLFNFLGWDQQDVLCFTYYNVTLNKDIGEFKKGTEFQCVDIDYKSGVLQFYDKGAYNVIGKFELAMTTDEKNLAGKDEGE